MRRFVTYLYEYESGRKARNVGFIKVDIRNAKVNMDVCIRNYIRATQVGRLYGLVKNENLLGIELGEVKVAGGQSNVRFTFSGETLGESEYSVHDLAGVGILFGNNEYLASCWKDEDAEEVGRGEFLFHQKKEEKVLCEIENRKEDIVKPSVEDENKEGYKTYCKIELDQIRNMPTSNWHLCNNSFLIHGFFNYGYLFLKKEQIEDKEVLWLGVPGFFEKQELVMAVLFGFSEFEAVPQEVTRLRIGEESIYYRTEKNQQPKTGIFGCWFVKLDE